MRTLRRKAIMVAVLAALSCTMTLEARTFSTMSVEEVSALLAEMVTVADKTASAKDAVSPEANQTSMPIPVTARDMVTKVFGVFDNRISRADCVAQAQAALNMTPEDDNGVLWLETASGYGLDYYGMTPDVSAMARFGNDNVADYGYFFLFPYDAAASKAASIETQTEFCSSLLQEMMDIGLPMDLNTVTDDLFEAVGDYNGDFVDVRLLDDRKDSGDGRFILILSVAPQAFTTADDVVAEL